MFSLLEVYFKFGLDVFHCGFFSISLIWFLVFNATKQYFNYIMVVSFIGGGNLSTRRKPPTCHKSLTNVIIVIIMYRFLQWIWHLTVLCCIKIKYANDEIYLHVYIRLLLYSVLIYYQRLLFLFHVGVDSKTKLFDLMKLSLVSCRVHCVGRK